LKDIIPYRLLKDYDGIITDMLNLRCVSVKVKRGGKKGKGEEKLEKNQKLPTASNAVGSKGINKSVPFNQSFNQSPLITLITLCLSQGHTLEEAVSNLKEATELYFEEFPLKEGRG
jgi:hypothetical protein